MTSIDPSLVILGSGGHAAVVAEAATRSGWRVVGVASREMPAAERPFERADWLGDPDDVDGRARIGALLAQGAKVHAAVGDATLRRRWTSFFEEHGIDALAAVVDPSAVVSPSARLAPGVFIATGAIVHARAVVGTGAIINTRAVVEHDCVVGEFAHVSPGAILCGGVRVGRSAQVGAGAVVVPNRSIGDGATVGAGAVVIRDVVSGVTAVGVPAVVRT